MTTCEVCGVQTYSQHLQAEEKQRHRDLGHKRHGGRGACVNCYVRLSKAGRIDELALIRGTADQADVTAKRCTRCSIRHAMPSELCRDCRDVLYDLGELADWEEPERLLSSA